MPRMYWEGASDMCFLPMDFCSRSSIIGQEFLAFIPVWYCSLAECYGGDNKNLFFPVRNVTYITVSSCHPIPYRSSVDTIQNLESTMWYHSFAGLIRGRAFCVTTVIELSLCTFPFTTGTDVLVFVIQKLVESWESLIALTVMKGLKFHLCLEVNMHSSASRSESLLVGCFLIRNGNHKLSWDFVLQVSPGGQRVSWWWQCRRVHGMACFCKMQLDFKSGVIQTIALFCSWKEKTRSNKCVTALRCIALSFSFCCGYPKQCCLSIKAMNWSLQKAVKSL